MSAYDAARLGLPSFRPRQREKRAPCADGCPNHADVRGWVGIVAQRRRLGLSRAQAYERAWRMIVERNPLPATIGRICPHPCEDQCNRAGLDAGVRVHLLERFLGDWALYYKPDLPLRPGTGISGSIGVIGAGPAGLSAAFQLARRDHAVTLYDRHPRPGGMLRYGIPDFRLPPRILDAEIDRILGLGVELRTECSVGRDLDLDELRRRHDALFIGIGAQRGRKLELPGANPDDVRTGIDYLYSVNQGSDPWCGENVVVVGGGNTAVDAARTARRSGAEVTVAYRRGRGEMPAFEEEIDAMLSDGIRLETLVAPSRVERRDGRVAAIVLQRMELGDVDESGRRRPVPIAGAEVRIPCDAVITAVAQEVGWDGLGRVQPTGGWLVAEDDGWVTQAQVWAGGDVLGAGFASRAIAEARRSAEAIHAHLSGTPRTVSRSLRLATPDTVRLPAYVPAPAASLHELQVASTEPVPTLPEDAFLREAARCLSCGLCFGCERCAMYCSADAFRPADPPRPGHYFVLNSAVCEECGKCVDLCPCGYLEFVDEDGDVQLSAGDSLPSRTAPEPTLSMR